VANELALVGKVETRPGKIENRDLTMVMIPILGVGHSLKEAERVAAEKAETAERKRLARAAAKAAPAKAAPAKATRAAAKAARAAAADNDSEAAKPAVETSETVTSG